MEHQQEQPQYYNYVGMENRPPDILGPDLVNSANSQYLAENPYPMDPAHYQGDGHQQMYDQSYQQYYNPMQQYYNYQPYSMDQQLSQQQFPDQQFGQQLPEQHQQLTDHQQHQVPEQHQQQPLPEQQQQQQLPEQHQQQHLPEQHQQPPLSDHHQQQHLPDQHPHQLSEQLHSQVPDRQHQQLPEQHQHLYREEQRHLQQHVPREHQQREPVDGGNEAVPTSLPPLSTSGLPTTSSHQEFEDNLNMPMERLVLGESEDGHHQQQQPQPSAPPPPMFSPIYAPPVSSYPSMPYGNVYHDQAFQPMTSYSATPPPSGDRFVAGEAGEQERIVTGYEEEQLGPAVTPTIPPSASLPPPPPSSERSEAAGSDRRDELPPPPPPSSSAATSGPSTQAQLPPPPLSASLAHFQMMPPPPPHSERSEAVGSDRRDESVMGPPPKSGLSPPPSSRRDVAGSDDLPRSKVPPQQLQHPVLPPQQQQPQQQHQHPVRNSQKGKVKEDYQYDSRRSDSDDEQEEDESVFSQSSEAVQQQQKQQQLQQQQLQQRKGTNSKHQRNDGARRDDPSSSDTEERTYNRHQRKPQNNPARVEQTPRNRHDSYNKRDARHHDERRGHHDRRHDRTYKGEDRSFRDERSFRDDRNYREDRNHDRSYREDRNFRDDRSYHGDYRRDPRERDHYGTVRKDRDRYSASRPSSRAGYPYVDDRGPTDWYGRRMIYPPDPLETSISAFYPYAMQTPYAPAPQAAAFSLDPSILETFRKNWEYYERNPKEKENLRLTDPGKFERLMMYYKMYSHLLPPQPTLAAADRPSSRASVGSGRSSVQGVAAVDTASKAVADYNNWNESTIHHPESSALGLTHFQPTLVDGRDEYGNDLNGGISTGLEVKYDPRDEYQMAPLKFSSPCVKGILCPQGMLIKIDAKSPLDGQHATVELHSLQIILTKENKELKHFPGPLVPGRTHKGEVIQFCQSKISAAKRSHQIVDRDSYILVWELLILLMRQKNAIDGSDIAELLLKDRRDIHLPYASKKVSPVEEEKDIGDVDSDDDQEKMQLSNKEKNETEEATAEVDGVKPLPFAQELERTTSKFRDFLLFGHKKEGLDYAMKHGLWGHALFLASKMDERTYSSVMLRFANGMAVNDPLQTLYQLMSGRQPIAVKECADQNWGDWRPHLAMILSNAGDRSDLYRKSILTLGDTLLEKGLMYGAHFCYIVANVEFGTYSSRNSKLVLIGSDHHLDFESFATNESIQCTEIFEYAQKLSNPDFAMLTLVYYKFVYIIRLIDGGKCHTALHYLEELTKLIVQHVSAIDADMMDAKSLINQVLHLAEHLKYMDPMYTTGEGEIMDMGEPQWLINYRSLVEQINSNNFDWSTQQSQTNSHGADSTDVVTSHQESHDFGDQQQQQQQQQQQYDSNQYYDQYQQQQHYDVDGSHAQQPQQHVYEQVHQENNQNQPWSSQLPGGENEQGPLVMKPVSPNGVNHDQQRLAGSVQESSNDPSSVDSSAHTSPVHAPLQSVPTYQPTSLPPLPAVSPPTSGGNGNYFSNIQAGNTTQPPPPQQQQKLPPAPQHQKAEENNKGPPKPAGKKKSDDKASAASTGMFSRFLGKIGLKAPSRAHLPDDKDQSIVWDEKTKRWIDKNASEDDASQTSMAPPSDVDLSRSNSSANFAGDAVDAKEKLVPLNNNTLAPPMGNRYAGGLGKRYGGAVGRIDVFKNSQSSPSLSSSAMPPPLPLIPPLAPIAIPGLLTPGSAPEPTTNGTAPSSPATAEPATQAGGPMASVYAAVPPPDPSQNWNGQPDLNPEHDQQQSWGVADPTADSGAPLGSAPVFFNPSQFAGPIPTTRRNKYA